MSEARGLRDIREGRTADGGVTAGLLLGAAGATLAYRNIKGVRTATHFMAKKLGLKKDDLPKNWKKLPKDEYGVIYYYNVVTQQKQTQLPRKPPPDPHALEDHWEEQQDDNGQTFYYDSITGHTTYSRPTKEPVAAHAPAAVVGFGYNGNPAPVHAPAAADAPVANSKAATKAAAKAGRRAARAQEAQPVAPTSKQAQPVAPTSKQQLKQAQHALELAKLHAKTAKLNVVAAKRVKEQKGPKAKGTDEWAVVRTKTTALGKASSQLKELITNTEKIGALNMTHPIHKFTTLMGEVTKQERRTTAQRLKKVDTVEDVKFLKSLLQQALAAFETYASLDVAKAYQLDAIRTLLSECIAAVEAASV